MITRLAEINRILVAAESICDETGSMTLQQLVEEVGNVAVESRRPQHEQTIEFCIKVELLHMVDERVTLTALGRDLLILNPQRMYDLQPDQQRTLLRRFYLHGPYREVTRQVLKAFMADATTGTYAWDPEAGSTLPCEPWFPLHLQELGLLSIQDADRYIVQSEYVEVIAELISTGDFSEEKFLARLAERKELGDLAEQLAYDAEVKRLRDLGFIKESLSVKLIGKLKTDAGYDLESYDGEAPSGMKPTRFIEVKGSGLDTVTFVWSSNEIQRARQLGQEYWIYFIGAIDRKRKRAKREVIRIQDPTRSVLEDPSYSKTPNGLLVEANLKGAILAQ